MNNMTSLIINTQNYNIKFKMLRTSPVYKRTSNLSRSYISDFLYESKSISPCLNQNLRSEEVTKKVQEIRINSEYFCRVNNKDASLTAETKKKTYNSTDML